MFGESALPGVFICYRRDESSVYARVLADTLADLGVLVFMDDAYVAAGTDFAAAIGSAIQRYRVMLVLIGPDWVTLRDGTGRRRLDDPQDFVVLELRGALDRRLRMIPILVNGALMPSAAQLPPPLAPLAGLNARTLQNDQRGAGFDRLVTEIISYAPPGNLLSSSGIVALLTDNEAAGQTKRLMQRGSPVDVRLAADTLRGSREHHALSDKLLVGFVASRSDDDVVNLILLRNLGKDVMIEMYLRRPPDRLACVLAKLRLLGRAYNHDLIYLPEYAWQEVVP